MSARDPNRFVENLSARARRGELSRAEEVEFEQELAGDQVLQLAHQLGLDMDRSTAVRAGDEALIARAADAALGRVAASGLSSQPKKNAARVSTAPRQRRRFAVLLAAALVSAAGIAAGMWARGLPARVSALKTEPREVPHAEVVVTRREAPPITPSATAEPNVEAPPSPGADAVASVAQPQRVVPRVPDVTASALFKSANAARRDSDFSAAERLYSELIAKYPSSDEAGLARVSLGKLLLANGDPSEAERQFGRYLKNGSGQLAEEALVSRALSFQKLGRASAERSTWQTLLAEYPNSVYAAEAKGRIDALQPATPSPAH